MPPGVDIVGGFFQALSDFLSSLLGLGGDAPPTLKREFSTQALKSMVYSNPPAGIAPDLAFTLFALEIGIFDFNWKPGKTFLKTRSISNRHVGSGKGYWTGDRELVLHTDGRAPEELRVYESPEQSLQDFAQLMNDPLYAQATARGRSRDRAGYFQGVTNAGYDTPQYAAKLEARYQSLKDRGVI